MAVTAKHRKTKEQIKAIWHRKAAARANDVICFRCGTLTNKIHHHCVAHKYAKGISVSVCTRCHGELNALVWNPEKHLLRGPYWGEKPVRLLIPECAKRPDMFELETAGSQPFLNPISPRKSGQTSEIENVTVISVCNKNTDDKYYIKGCSYSEMAGVTGISKSSIIDSYIGTFPLLIIGGQEYAVGFGPLTEYQIRDSSEDGSAEKAQIGSSEPMSSRIDEDGQLAPNLELSS